MANDIGIRIGLEGVAKYQRDLQRVEGNTTQKTRKIGGLFSGMGTAFRDAASQIPFLGSGIAALATPIGAATVAFAGLTAGIASATRVAGNFEQQIVKVGSLQGIDKTAAQFSLLSEEAQRLGSTTEFSATQAAQSMEFLTRAGFNATQVLAGTEQTLALATVGQLDLAKASDIASDTLSQFQLQAADLGSVVDIIAKTTITANTNVIQFADAMNYLGPTAKALGVSLAESSATIGILSSAGLKGSLATRALGTALIRLTKPTREAQKVIADLGIEAFNSEGQFIGLSGLIRELEQGFEGLNEKQRQSAIATIFGAEAVQELNILLGKGSRELARYTDEIQAAGNQNGKFSEEIRRQQLDTFQGSIKELTSAFEGLQIAFTGPFLDSFADFIRIAANGLRVITEFVKGTRSLKQVFVDNAEVITIAASVLIAYNRATIASTAATIANIVAEKGKALAVAAGNLAYKISIPLQALYITGTNLLTGKITLATAAQRAFNIVLTANPIGLVIVAVGALVAGFIALYKRSQLVRASVAGLSTAYLQFVDIIKTGVLNVIQGLGTALRGVFDLDVSAIKAGIKQATEGALDAIPLVSAIRNGNRLADAFTQGFEDRIKGERQAEVVETFLKQISTASRSEIVALQAAASNAFNQGRITGEQLIEITEAIKARYQELGPAIENVVNKINNIGGAVQQAIEQIDRLNSTVIQTRAITAPDTSLATPDNTEGLNAAIQGLGLDLQFVNQNFADTNELLDAMNSLGFRVADALGASTQGALTFAVALKNLKANAFRKSLDILGNSFEQLGRDIGIAIKSGESAAAAFQNFLATIVSESIKYLGLFFLKTATELPFPASIPFAIAGVALLGLSGLAGGLLSASPSGGATGSSTAGGGIGGAGLPQSSIQQAEGTNIGLSNIQQSAGSTTQNITILLDGEEITGRVLTSIEIQEQLAGQPG